MSEAVSTLAADAAPGRQLAAARASCGLSVADIARQLKLSPWQIEALEADDYRRLPGTVFVRGFIRNYANLVKLDAAPLLANSRQQSSAATQAAPEMPRSVGTFPSGREFGWHKYAIAAIVVLIPLVIFEFYREETHEVTVKSRQIALPAPQIVAEQKPAAAASVPVEPGPRPTVAQEKAVPDTPPVTAKPVSGERKPGEQLVSFRFEQESWVEVRDRNGRKIFSQLNPAGTEQVVSGRPPLSLVVGNAGGVRLLYNDQPVDLAPHVKVDVARLTLE